MVAAAFEPRILSNLIADEKEYHKHLLVLLDTYAHHSLSSLSAFASVSPASVSRSLIVVAGSLAGADDALRRYAGSVEAWETEMGAFKDAYDEVNAAVREREQHVIRLYEDSEKEKSRKGTSIASSLPSPDSSKSDDSQAELKTLESQIEEKKQRMDGLLVEAVRRGLYGRCKAMMECGQTWLEMGQAGLRVLEGIGQGRDAEPRAIPPSIPRSTSPRIHVNIPPQIISPPPIGLPGVPPGIQPYNHIVQHPQYPPYFPPPQVVQPGAFPQFPPYVPQPQYVVGQPQAPIIIPGRPPSPSPIQVVVPQSPPRQPQVIFAPTPSPPSPPRTIVIPPPQQPQPVPVIMPPSPRSPQPGGWYGRPATPPSRHRPSRDRGGSRTFLKGFVDLFRKDEAKAPRSVNSYNDNGYYNPQYGPPTIVGTASPGYSYRESEVDESDNGYARSVMSKGMSAISRPYTTFTSRTQNTQQSNTSRMNSRWPVPPPRAASPPRPHSVDSLYPSPRTETMPYDTPVIPPYPRAGRRQRTSSLDSFRSRRSPRPLLTPVRPVPVRPGESWGGRSPSPSPPWASGPPAPSRTARSLDLGVSSPPPTGLWPKDTPVIAPLGVPALPKQERAPVKPAWGRDTLSELSLELGSRPPVLRNAGDEEEDDDDAASVSSYATVQDEEALVA